MAIVAQALVAIGGRATRLTGVPVAVSKAFLTGLDDMPFLFWCLRSLEMAGIRRVVLAADHPQQERLAWTVLGEREWSFEKVETFSDGGLGVHGIPHQAIARLEGDVLFEAGHGVCSPEHYRAIAARKKPGTVVFSAFVPRADNPRFLTGLGAGGRCRPPEEHDVWALAHPMVIDRDYAARLPEHGFAVDGIASWYRRAGRLHAVRAPTPVEFDVAREYRRTLAVHRERASHGEQRLPWQPLPPVPAAELTDERPDAVLPARGVDR